jgi:hypothetical protein
MSEHESDVTKGETQKKDYAPPEIVHTEELTAAATTCAKADSTCTTNGQIGPLRS